MSKSKALNHKSHKDKFLQAGEKARELRKQLGYTYLACEQISQAMRELRASLTFASKATRITKISEKQESID